MLKTHIPEIAPRWRLRFLGPIFGAGFWTVRHRHNVHSPLRPCFGKDTNFSYINFIPLFFRLSLF